jgi:hypothetical protein
MHFWIIYESWDPNIGINAGKPLFEKFNYLLIFKIQNSQEGQNCLQIFSMKMAYVNHHCFFKYNNAFILTRCIYFFH